MISIIQKHFDVIIIDSNSSLNHITTQPLAAMSKRCYYITNLDFNNVKNNIRYLDTLKQNEILDKTKFVLNEDITEDVEGYENLQFTAQKIKDELEELAFEAKIPLINKPTFLNCIFEGKPLSLLDTDETLKARYEITKIANQIYPVSNFDKMTKQVEELDTKEVKKGSKFSKLFK